MRCPVVWITKREGGVRELGRGVIVMEELCEGV